MGTFGERIGARPLNDVVQTKSVDPNTRVAIWNVMHGIIKKLASGEHPKTARFMKSLWADVFHYPLDEYYWGTCEFRLKERVLSGDWVDALETVEGFSDTMGEVLGVEFGAKFQEVINVELSNGLIGYRFIGSELAAVDDDRSAEEVSDAIASAPDSSSSHLQRAVTLLADKQNPQYGKVAGEAIMAVEASVFNLTGKKTLGEGVRELGNRGLPVHPAILKAWSAMYGYTSDAGGIRHANIGGEEVDGALAIYLLVTSAAFINLLTKVAATGK